MLLSDELRAALTIQGAYRSKQARKVARVKRAHDLTAHMPDDFVWQPIADAKSGSVYFYNRDTGEVTWEVHGYTEDEHVLY